MMVRGIGPGRRAAVMLFGLAVAAGCAAKAPPPPAADPRPDSLVWARSAEYVASCLQVFNVALERLRALPPEPAGGPPRAIVMDLDETVLDNFDFQLELAESGASYSEERWAEWVKRDRAALLPGAGRFIEAVRGLGIEVVFLSNRSERLRAETLKTLRRLGAGPASAEPVMYLKQDTSNKQARREAVRSRYEVVAYFGDNLADFEEGFEAAVRGDREARRAHACAARERWGVSWFVLPNPMYGAWQHLPRPTPLEVPPEACP